MSETDPMDPGAVDPGATAAPLPTRWQQAEGQLFGALAMAPELYQQVVLVLSATTDQLRAELAATAALLEAQDRAVAVVTARARELGVALDATSVERIALTALAIRYREVTVAEQARGRLELLAGARAAGQDWVVLEESGDPAGSPFAPYRRVEAEARSGRALLVRTEPAEDYRTVTHHVARLQLDLATGALADPAGEPDETTAADAEERESWVARLREV
ncbi:MAG TPA: hypothetical protein VFN19_02495 [Candidatus Nanopelagicales bacterium]|nr:hypothetical protein [Candidatus Nanopelagicales bacterium]